MSEGHTHPENTEPAPEQQIYFPPAEMMLQEMRNEYAQKCVEVYELASAARFQAGLLENFQGQMVELSTQVSQLKAEIAELKGEDPEVLEVSGEIVTSDN
jgi:hypothetical protein